MQYAYATGYDPQAAIAYFEKIEAQEKKKPGMPKKRVILKPPQAGETQPQVDVDRTLQFSAILDTMA